MATQDNLYTEQQAAEYIGGTETPIPLGTMRRWRIEGKFLKFLRIGAKAVRYRKTDLDAYLDSCSRTSTTDQGSANDD
ncbi:MAG: helix-turn-helix domain-containing protein [Emcibacter sp.]|nr:helix-turn-helix domain-containing protein [Emcibacter sp.]